MLSAENLHEYCRTCLVKLENTYENCARKSVSINQFPEIEHLIRVCLSKATATRESLSFYTFLCRSCFDKWSDFSQLYQLAIKTDEKIRKALGKEILKTEIIKEKLSTTNCKINEYFFNNEPLVDINEVAKCEIDSLFCTNNNLNNPIKIKHKAVILSDNTDAEIDVIHESKKRSGAGPKNFGKCGSTRKSLCELNKTYKTRNTFNNTDDYHLPGNQDSEKQKNFASDVEKKIRYQCQQCCKYFWQKNKYEGHMKQVHEGIKRPFKCEECGKAYNLYKTLLQHKRELHTAKLQKLFKCDKCDKKFKTGVILKQHLNNKHSEVKETMRTICDQCGFIAAHQYSLSRHIINKHTETDHLKCEHCPKLFKTRYSLKYHIIGNHNPSNMKPFKCNDCQMGFTRKTLLNQHQRTHIKYNERIKCDFEGCEVRFVKHGDKTHHMRLVHLKVKQHICDFCGDAFGAMQTLRHHRFIHTGEKPYKCNICDQGFRQRTAMKTHRKTHFGKETERQVLINGTPEVNLSLINSIRS